MADLGLGAGGRPYTFALVPKNTNNPFFDQALAGCKKAEAELKGAVKCLYIGPGEHGGGDEEAQIVADLITKKVDGIAVSPANAPAMANALKGAAAAKIPVLTWDSDLLPQGQGPARSPMSARTTTTSASTSPSSSCRSSPRAARSASSRAARRRPTTTSACRASATRSSGKKSAESPGERLTGQNGWTEVDGCPLYTDDDFPLSVQQMEDILAKYPNLDAFTPTGGFPQFLPDAYEKIASKYKDKIASGALALVVADTLPVQIDLMKKGLSAGQVGQRPFEMGYKAMYFLKDIKDGKPRAGRPDLHRSRRLHAEDRRHLRRRLTLAFVGG